jgi:Mg2+ and Co2+ transporter CorA
MTSLFVNVPKNNTIITYNDHVVGTPMNETKSQRSSPLQFKDWLRVQQELGKSYSKLRQYDGQYLTYALLDQAVDLIGPIVATMRHEIAREKEIARKTKFERLERIHQLREELEKVARKLKPFMRLLVHVIEDEAISPGATVYLRDVLDNLEGHDDDVKQLIVESEAIDTDADKFRSHQMDQTLYTLTVISAVFLPAQFLTGVWGMNFVYMPELDEKWGYAMFWALSAFMMVALVVTLNFGRLR